MKEQLISRRQFWGRSIFAFVFFIACFAGAIYAWKKIRAEPQDNGIPHSLRKGLMANEQVFGGLFSAHKLVPTYPKSEAARRVRVNGAVGLRDASFDPAAWQLKVTRANGDTLSIGLDELRQLPKADVVFDFKCIEGWSQKTWWAGVRFSDFVKHYHLEGESQLSYASLVTPDHEYYVGIDMASMMQPQTLLCYEMNGRPLPMDQGFPLRLIIPVKYGIKHLKRIGTISFSNQRPPDYWAERGYDYYAGH